MLPHVVGPCGGSDRERERESQTEEATLHHSLGERKRAKPAFRGTDYGSDAQETLIAIRGEYPRLRHIDCTAPRP